MRKPAFCICENKDADQLRGYAKLISAFVFASRIVQSLYFLNSKFPASSDLLWLHSPVCVVPGGKPRRPVFSQRGSYDTERGPPFQVSSKEMEKPRINLMTHAPLLHMARCLTHYARELLFTLLKYRMW